MATSTRTQPIQGVQQITSWGKPPLRSRVPFARFIKPYLESITGVMFVLAVLGWVLMLALLVVVGFVVKHSDVYASDGTRFSCQVPTIEQPQPQANKGRS